LAVPHWWIGEPQFESWQAVCSSLEGHLPAILKRVEECLHKETSYPSSDTIKRLFIEQIAQQLSWEVKPQDSYLVASYVTPPLLEKTADVLKSAIDTTRQDAMAQWMSQVADQLKAIQQATVSLTASSTAVTAMRQLTPSAVQIVQKQQSEMYDVYISYNQADRAEIVDIVEKLKARGILTWLDVQEVRPGRERMHSQETKILTIPVAAIFVGQYGVLGEQELETHSFIKQFIKRDIPVIPVILPSAPAELELPPFLGNFFEVDFHRPIPDPLEQLIWGITGEPP
jgi:hypothetical protein